MRACVIAVLVLALVGCETFGGGAEKGSKGKEECKTECKTGTSMARPPRPDSVPDIVSDLHDEADVNLSRCEQFLELVMAGKTSKEQHKAFVEAMRSSWAYQVLRVEHLICALIAAREKREGS